MVCFFSSLSLILDFFLIFIRLFCFEVLTDLFIHIINLIPVCVLCCVGLILGCVPWCVAWVRCSEAMCCAVIPVCAWCSGEP